MSHVSLTPRFEEALVYAVQLHARQTRKQTEVPYITHLLSVIALVLEDGGDEDQAISALLHDAVEDQGGLDTLNEIRSRFGDTVADIVDECTDAYTVPKPPWRERKERYIKNLRHAQADVKRVSIADKLHNARTILVGLRQEGDIVWTRFIGGKSGSLWYYRSLVEVFQETRKDLGNSSLVDEFTRVVAELEHLAMSAE